MIIAGCDEDRDADQAVAGSGAVEHYQVLISSAFWSTSRCWWPKSGGRTRVIGCWRRCASYAAARGIRARRRSTGASPRLLHGAAIDSGGAVTLVRESLFMHSSQAVALAFHGAAPTVVCTSRDGARTSTTSAMEKPESASSWNSRSATAWKYGHGLQRRALLG